ncbi:RNA polymerase-binding protein RbpA [Gephyromycinifex aptenodytis]|uniref:RNA polymerase-binding protein RbpA n=1 Tax=Gephyromycinifex aptenodytis TaxID=2716227 RepID=UPI001445F5DA|nr:RNA polymerase-binding protein RbpA [Gephyromycinifex aptenodytis]
MAGTSVIKGSRVGAGPMGEAERGQPADRVTVQYWCANGHVSSPQFSAEGVVPELWECPRCGSPAGQDSANPPPAHRHEPYKTHLAYVKERRTEEDGEALLDEALSSLRSRGVIR